MQTLAAPLVERQPARPHVAPPPAPADRLERLARRVARLGHGARDAESFLLQRETLARELLRLARELDR